MTETIVTASIVGSALIGFTSGVIFWIYVFDTIFDK